MGMVILFLLSHVQYILAAVVAYFCGCINGAILISKHYLKEDVRTRGSGNAGLTNFYRNYGPKYAALVIVLDALKMVAAVVIACMILGWGPVPKLIGGLFCILGHIFPVTFRFKGGKGILSGVTLLFMLDWRVGLIVLFAALATMAISKYVSLGSIVGAFTFPTFIAVFTFLVDKDYNWIVFITSVIMCALAVWRHRTNIVRLANGTESKLGKKKEA